MSIHTLGRFLSYKTVLPCATKRWLSTLKFVETGEVELPKPPKIDYFGPLSGAYGLVDSTMARITDNSRVVCVEGNIACGKSFLASQLAKHFGLIHIPDPTEDDIYIFNNVKPPFDLRIHNSLLPKSAKYYTFDMFWTEPDLKNNGKPMYLQFQLFLRRLFNYTKGINTLFSTGRGIVFDRSPFSDLAWSDALYECGYISERAHRWFNQTHGKVCYSVMKPHLIVLIKNPTSQLREFIRRRNIPWEMNSVNLSDKFLDTYTRVLEKNYIIPMSRFSEIAVVDGSTTDIFDEADCLAIAKQLSEIDLSGDRLTRDDKKFLQWRNALSLRFSAAVKRITFANVKDAFGDLVREINIPSDLYELCYTYDDRELQIKVLHMDPRTTYSLQFNPYYSSVFDIMFNPSLASRNYHVDAPKILLWP